MAGKRALTSIDAAFVLVVVLLSAAYHGVYAGRERPFVGLSGDSANIATFAAATDHPELFVGDPLLGDRANFGFYTAIQVRLNGWLARRTGDYGIASTALLGVTLAVYLLGWYVFGCLFWRDRALGAAWALLQFAHVRIGFGEYWGPYADVQPRFMFQAALPWLLVLLLTVGRRGPGTWPMLLLAAGAMVSLHPVSAPGWGLAVLLSLWCLPAPGLSPRRRLLWIGLSAGALAAALMPFTLAYFSRLQSPTAISGELARELVSTRLNRGYTSLPYAVAQFGWNLLKRGILPMALVGAWSAWRRRTRLDDLDREHLRLATAWLAGLLVVGLVLPAIDQLAAKLLHRLPVQYDLIRQLRYVPLFFYGLWFWPLAIWCRAAGVENRQRRLVPLALAVVWATVHHPFIYRPEVREDPLNRDAVAAVQREVPPLGKVMVISGLGLAVRYGALRPVVFCVKDGGCFSYAQPDRLLAWSEQWKRFRELQALPLGSERLAESLRLTRDCGGEYLLTTWPNAELPENGELVLLHRNAKYALFRLAPAG